VRGRAGRAWRRKPFGRGKSSTRARAKGQGPEVSRQAGGLLGAPRTAPERVTLLADLPGEVRAGKVSTSKAEGEPFTGRG
jgi:hypothetical protein